MVNGIRGLEFTRAADASFGGVGRFFCAVGVFWGRPNVRSVGLLFVLLVCDLVPSLALCVFFVGNIKIVLTI